MLLLLSPAKSLDYTSPLPPLEATAPRFAEEALATAQAASKLSAKKLAGPGFHPPNFPRSSPG